MTGVWGPDMSKPLRIATICHNEDNYRDPAHRRVRLELHPVPEGYVWRTADGQDCCIGACRTVAYATWAARSAWGAAVWDLRASWL